MNIKQPYRRKFLKLVAAISSGMGLSGCTDDEAQKTNTKSAFDPSEAFDVCVVGSGPAGTILTSELCQQGTKTLLVEGGSRPLTAVNLPSGRYPVEQTRYQGLGGTSNLWDGTCPRLLPTDFHDNNPYILDGNGWPINYEELMPYYYKAEKELRVYGTANSYTAPRERPYPVSPPEGFEQTATFRIFEKAGLSVVIEPKSGNKGIRVSETHIPKIVDSPNARILNDYKVTRIVCNEGGQVIGLEAIAPSDKKVVLTAKKYVLACGGIETPRLLLLSRSKQWPNGIGNNYDKVGRYFHEHLWLPLSRARIELSDKYVSLPKVEGIIWEYTNQLKQEGLGASYFECSIISPKDSKKNKNGSLVKITAMLGMEPQKSNRVVLDEENLDPWGLPSVSVEVELSRRDLASINRLSEISTEILKRIGATRVKTKDSRGGTGWTRWTHHHMGTCRMGVDNRTAVVDGNMKVHGTENLYVAGSSCFVTPGANGPTLLLTALALRLADHLRQT